MRLAKTRLLPLRRRGVTLSSMRPTALALVLAGLAAACAAPSPAPSLPAEDPGVPAAPEDIAPQPYTAAAIRASHPVGTFTTYRITAPGGTPMEQRTEWVESTLDGCVMAAETPPGAEESLRASALWWELRDHASFPAAATSVERKAIAIAAGTFECLHYAVELPAAQGGGTRHFWFDTRTAGSPVLFTQEVGGQEVYRMELVAMNRKPFAAE